MVDLRSVIIGTGSYVPEQVVTNDDLAKTVDTSHEWIIERTGIEQRQFASKDQKTSDLATYAAKEALDRAGLVANDIDMIIVATSSGDYTFPSCATRVQDKIGNTKGFAFDVAGACAGYLIALNVADNFLKLNKGKRVLVIGAEIISKMMDMSDRSTCVLFGDGAGAIVLESVASDQVEHNSGIIGVDMQSDGRLVDILRTDGGPSSTGTVGRMRMSGQDVFKHAITKLASSAEHALAKYDIHINDLDWLIPHQANLRIIEGLGKKLGIAPEKVIVTVNKHANTSAASIPLALHDAVLQNKVKKGDLILHESIGGGLVWGSALLRF